MTPVMELPCPRSLEDVMLCLSKIILRADQRYNFVYLVLRVTCVFCSVCLLCFVLCDLCV